jgi:hypothetical protein
VLQNPHDIGHVLLVADGCADVANKVAAIAASILGMFFKKSGDKRPLKISSSELSGEGNCHRFSSRELVKEIFATLPFLSLVKNCGDFASTVN